MRHLIAILVLGLSVGAFVTDALSAPPVAARQTSRPADTAAAGSDKKPESPDEEDEKEKDRFFAITGATVHPMAGPTRTDVTILCKNGKIRAIGDELGLPDDARVLEADGYHVYPGLVAVSSIGVVGAEPPEDTSDVYSLSAVLALAGGITTVVTGNTAAKVNFGTLEDQVVKRDLFVSINYATRSPGSRRSLRASFDRLRQYLRDLEAYEEKKKTDSEAEPPGKSWIRGNNAKYLALLKRESVAVTSANTAHELIEVCDLATQYGIGVVVRGAYEGWTVAPRLARSGVAVIVTPRRRVDVDDERNRSTGSSITNAAVLHAHGVRLAIIPGRSAITTWGLAGRDLFHLPMEAAFAVRGGLPNQAAERAITIDAARILGIDHRVGSIEIGKDGDFVVCDGELLGYLTHARWTVVNGRIAYDKQKETLFDHIRPDGDLDAPPPDDHWPRRLGADW